MRSWDSDFNRKIIYILRNVTVINKEKNIGKAAVLNHPEMKEKKGKKIIIE